MINGEKLSRLSAMWKKVVSIVPSFSNVPDGDYVGDIKEMRLGESKAGRSQVVTTIEIVDGEYIGKTVKRFDGVEEETGMGYFKHINEVIGLDLPADLNVWQEIMDAFVGDPNRVDLYDVTTKTTKGKEGQEYSNVYINGISEYTKGEGEPVAEEVAEEAVEEEMEVVEMEPVQEIVAPTRRVAPKPVTQPAKAVAQPMRRVATAPAPVPVQSARKIVSLRK